jgi:hypothetical protein
LFEFRNFPGVILPPDASVEGRDPAGTGRGDRLGDHDEHAGPMRFFSRSRAPQFTGRRLQGVVPEEMTILILSSTAIFVVTNASRVPTEYRATAKVPEPRDVNSALTWNISLLTWDEAVNSELQIAESQPGRAGAKTLNRAPSRRDRGDPSIRRR